MTTTRGLAGRVAVVTGASKGVGKGVALALGDAGATVWVTGRSAAKLEETAAEVTRRGGRGVVAPCDHADDAAVEALFARLGREEGRLDVLVNNAFATPDGEVFGKFWELPVAQWDVFANVGLRSHFVASVFAARAMIPQKRGLIANISSFGAKHYAISVAYGAAKAGLDRMARDMGIELKPHGIASVALWPGIVRTERLVALGDASPFDLAKGESAEYTGRAVVALASDPDVLARTSKSHVVADLAEAYGFTDVDGTRPRAF